MLTDGLLVSLCHPEYDRHPLGVTPRSLRHLLQPPGDGLQVADQVGQASRPGLGHEPRIYQRGELGADVGERRRKAGLAARPSLTSTWWASARTRATASTTAAVTAGSADRPAARRWAKPSASQAGPPASAITRSAAHAAQSSSSAPAPGYGCRLMASFALTGSRLAMEATP